MFYLVKTPAILKKLYPGCLWNFNRNDKVVYLTFDDGPHPVVTPFVLDTLKSYDAKATFFCIGKNVKAQGDLYKRILSEGHTVGNHTFNHLNGTKVSDKDYMQDIKEARKYIDSNLFRPPYGRISRFQIRLLTNAENNRHQQAFQIVMWDVLSADFDQSLSAEKCISNVVKNTTGGSIVVFHDSEKAFPRLEKTLPSVMQTLVEKGFRFQSIA